MASGTGFPTNVDTTDNYGQWANNAQTTLNGAITAGATSIVVTDATGIPTTGGYFISIEAEIIFCIGRTGNTLSVDTRGAGGTTAAAHADTTPVNMFLVADNINDLIDAIIAMQTEIGSDTPAVGTVKQRLDAVESTNASQTTDIGTNQTNIAQNTSDISSNDTDIATNVSNISANTTAIGTNNTNIAQNASDIAQNASDVAQNATDIASEITNRANADTNLQNQIDSNDTDIGTNQTNIAQNTSDISDNTTDIAEHRQTTGTSDGDTNMGSYTDPQSVLTDNAPTKTNIQDLLTYVTHPNRREWVINGGWSNFPANGTEQMSWGHTAGNDGWVADIDMELIAMSIHVNPTTGAGSAELRLEIDGVQQTGAGNVIILDGNVGSDGETMSREDGLLILGTPIQITAGEVVHAVIVTSAWGNTGSDGTVTLRFRGR